MSIAGWAGSVTFHALLIVLALLGLPELWRDNQPVADVITVDVITIAEEAAVPLPEPEPEREPEREPEPEPAPEPEPGPEPEPEVPVAPQPAALPEPEHSPLVEEAESQPVADTIEVPAPLPAAKPDVPRPPEEEVSFANVRESLLIDRQEPEPEPETTTFADVESALDIPPEVPVSDEELATLRQSIANQITRRWIIQSGAIDARDLIVTIEVVLSAEARVLRARIVDVEGGQTDHTRRVAAESALRAVLFFRDHPFENLDGDRYAVWRELIVRFDPSSMF